MELNAFDLSRITKDDLRKPQPLSNWPTIKVNVDEMKEKTCIASWRWDVNSINEVSYRMCECAWDALNLKYSYLLCDIITIPQDSTDKIQILITFSKLYESLHSVIAYDTDPDIKRTWLKNEAIKILNSPTTLFYIYHKWKLRVPLIFSLIIRQICTRRLGLHEIDFSRLELCDTTDNNEVTLRDLDLFASNTLSRRIVTISLDRRRQKYASDVLLVYEISLSTPRLEIINKISLFKSNCIGIPALLTIWALVEGLSISVRGCDWDVVAISEWVYKIIENASLKSKGEVNFKATEKHSIFFLDGAINGKLELEITELTERLALLGGFKNLLVRCQDAKAKNLGSSYISEFLENCIDFVQLSIKDNILKEPSNLAEDGPQYDIDFDNNEHY